jgi:hypothetical protein
MGGGALVGGILGQNKNKLGKDFFDIQGNQEAMNRSQAFYNPNSQLYKQAGKGFYNRLQSTIPSTAGFLQQLAAQGINSPTVANMQRQAALKKAGQQASDYESDLFGNMQSVGANYMQQYFGNQQFSKSAYANQFNQDNPYPSLMNMGAGILGYQLGEGFGGGSSVSNNSPTDSGYRRGNSSRFRPFTNPSWSSD